MTVRRRITIEKKDTHLYDRLSISAIYVDRQIFDGMPTGCSLRAEILGTAL